MSYHSVNASKSIVWVDDSGNTHDITKVVYCNNYGVPVTIWPCVAELTDVYITELKSGDGTWDVKHRYTLSNNGDPSFYLKPSRMDPTDTHYPETMYAITGTVVFYKKDQPGIIEKTVENCYFFAETSGYVPGDTGDTGHILASPNVVRYGDRLPSDGSGTPVHSSWVSYAQWYADETVGHVAARSVQVGWYGSETYVQNGFLFDTNYTSPFILKRADIDRYVRLYNNSNETGNSTVGSSQQIMRAGTSITVWPKYYDSAYHESWGNDTWEKYSLADDLTLNDITYNSSYVSVVINQNHSITITALQPGTTSVTFGTNGQYTHAYSLSLYIQAEALYRLEVNNSDVTGSTVTINETENVYIKQCTDYLEHSGNPNEFTWNNYTGTATINSQNNAFTVGNGSENYIKTLTADITQPGVESDITVTLSNGTILTFKAKVGSVSSLWAKGISYDNWTTLTPQYTYDVYWNYNNYESYSIAISSSSSGTPAYTPYVQQGEYSVGNGKVYVSCGSGGIFLAKGNEPDNNSTFVLSVYDYQGGTLKGTITVHIVK